MKTMSSQRHEHLVKSAARTIGMMNQGVDPDAALTKVASEDGLNKNEIELVSHAINTSATLSHLESAAPKDKDKIFPITNAERVVARVYDGGQNESQDEVDARLRKDAPKPGKSNVNDVKKVASIQRSYEDRGTYLDVGTDHRPDARDAFGPSCPALPGVAVDPQVKIARLARVIDEARTRAAGARDEMYRCLEKAAQALEPQSGPRFERVERAAAAHGVYPELLDQLYKGAELDRRGQRRADLTKQAAAEVTPAEHRVLEQILRAENQLKLAIDCSTAHMILQDERAELIKQASAGDGAAAALDASMTAEPAHLSSGFLSDPGKMLHGGHEGGTGGLLHDVSGSSAGSAEAERLTGKMTANPLDVNSRQELENHATGGLFQHIMSDDVIGKYPLADVVKAFNDARHSGAKLGPPEITALVRQHLTTEGGIPLDTLLRARKAGQPGGGDRQ